MEHRTKRNHPLYDLVYEYETMLSEGNLSYLAEKNFFQLIQYYQTEFLFEKAIEVVDHALQQHSFCVDFYLIKARLLMNNHRTEEAFEYIEKAETISPGDVDVKLMKVRILASMESHHEAFALLAKIKDAAISTDMVEIYICEAYVKESLKDFSGMFKSLRKALLLDPVNELALEKIWVSVELSKKYKASIKLHQQILDKDAYNYLAWFNLGHAFACLGRYQKAIMAIEYSFLITKDFELGYLDCAELCCQVKDFKRALDIYKEYVSNFEIDEEIVVKLAECYIHLKEYKKAKEYLIAALKLNQYNDEVYYYLGVCFYEEGNYSNAISAILKAVDIEDRREEYYAQLADAYAKNNEYGKADFYYSKATEIGPEQELYWTRHIQFLLEQGNVDKALEVVEEAEYNTVGTELTYCKSACLLAHGDRKMALRFLEEALSEDVDNSDILYKLVPEIEEDKDIQSMIRYFQGEKIFK